MQHQRTLQFIDAIARAGSIRAAAQTMNITASALNRRLLAIEREIDAPLFERLASGVRLSAAGELFLFHARRQLADMERVRSQIEDMKGARRGHIAFGFDSALVADGFGETIRAYRADHSEVSFAVERLPRSDIAEGLADYRFDLGAVIEPPAAAHLATLATAPVSIAAVMRREHPLAGSGTVGLNELMVHPLVMPASGSLRSLLDRAALRQDFRLRPVIECDMVFAAATLRDSDAIGFQADTSTRNEALLPGMVAVPLRTRDLPTPLLHLIQLRGRSLPVAASRYADTLLRRFARYSGEM